MNHYSESAEAHRTDTTEGDAIIVTGDLVLDVPDADHWLSGIASALKQADLVIGHLEVPHTDSLHEVPGDVPAPGAPPENLDALQRAGFSAVTLAGNHMYDCGEDGLADTIARLDSLSIASCGGGPNLAAARMAALLPVGERVVALLSYNCVGPELSWAAVDKGGTAYLRVHAEDGGTITPKKNLTHIAGEAASFLRTDISRARHEAVRQFGDRPLLIMVALHKGIVHTPAKLAPYERELAHMAVDAGADVVISHHAHIVRGMEYYKGKPIYHGLGNGCVVTEALSPDQDHPARAEWAQQRKKLFGFEPDPAYRLAPFHPEAVNAFLGRLVWEKDGRVTAGFMPVHIDPPGRPVMADAAQAARIIAYVQDITGQAGLPSLTLTPKADMVTFS